MSFAEIEGGPCVAIRIKWSKTDQCKLGIHRPLVATGCGLRPAQGIAQWLDVEIWRPLTYTGVSRSAISPKINRPPKEPRAGVRGGPRKSAHPFYARRMRSNVVRKRGGPNLYSEVGEMEIARIYEVCMARECEAPYPKLHPNAKQKLE